VQFLSGRNQCQKLLSSSFSRTSVNHGSAFTALRYTKTLVEELSACVASACARSVSSQFIGVCFAYHEKPLLQSKSAMPQRAAFDGGNGTGPTPFAEQGIKTVEELIFHVGGHGGRRAAGGFLSQSAAAAAARRKPTRCIVGKAWKTRGVEQGA